MQASPKFFAAVHQVLIERLRHKLFGAAIATMSAAGLIGTLVTFWPH
jgi:hypothetical protein